MLTRLREALRFFWLGRSLVLETDVAPDEARRRLEARIDISERDIFRLQPRWEGKVSDSSFELRYFHLMNHPLVVDGSIEGIDGGSRITVRIAAHAMSWIVSALVGVMLTVASLLVVLTKSVFGGLLAPLAWIPTALIALFLDHNARAVERELRSLYRTVRVDVGEGAYRAAKVRVEPESEPAELPEPKKKKKDTWDASEL